MTHEQFRRLYEGEFPSQKRQCAHTAEASLQRCVNEAEFGLVKPDTTHRYEDFIEPVCAQCLPEAVRRGLKRNEQVVILRLAS